MLMYVTAVGYRPVATHYFIRVGANHQPVYMLGHYNLTNVTQSGWLQNTFTLGRVRNLPHQKVAGLVLLVFLITWFLAIRLS